jgi:hypothetical protein
MVEGIDSLRVRICAAVLASLVGSVSAWLGVDAPHPNTEGSSSRLQRPVGDERVRAFNHIGTFNVPANLPPGEPLSTVTSAEIVDASADGKTLLYTDSPTRRLGFIDISDPAQPAAAGTVALGGEPTSVAVLGEWALVAVNTSVDPDGKEGPRSAFDAPSGELVIVDIATKVVRRRITLAGQPDSIAISPDRRFAAIVIENERDEDRNDGLIPQLPPGVLQLIELARPLAAWMPETIDLSGLAEIAPDDPEPEFVDINAKNQAVVSLQENNHLVIIDLPSRKIVSHFSAGSATIEKVDATQQKIGPNKAGLIQLSDTITRRREPDAVAWIDDDTFATANEGDYEDADGKKGGARSFTLFHVSGEVEYELGSAFEHEIVRAGHYPEGRSGNKGSEPEGLAVGIFGSRKLLFVGSERANVVGVYDVTQGAPVFLQLLPTGIEPEGLKAIPGRGLLAVSAELDGLDEGFAIRPIVTLYSLQGEAARYPQLISGYADATPIPWVAISGLSGDPNSANTLWAVSDSHLAQGFIYRVDTAHTPARIEQRIAVGQADGSLDLEGIAARSEGGFWLASEGLAKGRANALVRVDAAGAILARVELPAELVVHATDSGLVGVAVTGCAADGDEIVWVALQREWADDPTGRVKIGRYAVSAGTWSFAHYPLDSSESPNGGWVGLSELTARPDGTLLVVERDNQIALDARIKRLYTIAPASATFAPYGQSLPILKKTLVHDVLSELDAHSISVPDKLEGVGLTRDGKLYLATDNDGVDKNYGETLFFALP